MRETVRHRVALRLLLQLIIANCRGRIQRFFEIARFKHLSRAIGMIRPHPSQAVGLQFETHRQLVGLDLANPLPGGLDLVGYAQQVLYMMADLVGDDVGLAKSPGARKRLRNSS